jgi:hypothetical protein
VKNLLITIMATLVWVGAYGQGTFQNLDFESASIPSGTQPGSGAFISSALPGWTPSGAIYDGVSLGGAIICIEDGLGGWPRPLQGTYSPALFGGYSPIVGVSSTISQTALVPNGTTSLLMDAQPVFSWNYGFTVSLGGRTVSMVPLETFSSYTVYGGDISVFAGQTAQLSITVPPPPSYSPNPNGFLFDNIMFSTIPEPSVLGLAAVGLLLVGWRVLERRRCQRN